VVLVAAMAGACDDNPVTPSEITSQTWSLVSLQREGSDPVVIANPSLYTLRLEEDGRVGVKSDCNSCSGTYSINGSTVELGAVTCTLIACPAGSLDRDYAGALEGPKTVTVDDSQMTIRGNGVTLRFRR
jgi:heat shock protein HslJ